MASEAMEKASPGFREREMESWPVPAGSGHGAKTHTNDALAYLNRSSAMPNASATEPLAA